MNEIEVKRILINKINDLKTIKDLSNWSVNLADFFTFYKSEEPFKTALKKICNKKAIDYKQYFKNYKNFSTELLHLFNQLKKELYEINNLPKFPYSICNKEFSYKNLQNPFEEPEKYFLENINVLTDFFKNLIDKISLSANSIFKNAIKLLTSYLDISTKIFSKEELKQDDLKCIPKGFLCQKIQLFDKSVRYNIYEPILNINIKSLIFYKVETKANSLAHNKSASLWKKLDLIYK